MSNQCSKITLIQFSENVRPVKLDCTWTDVQRTGCLFAGSAFHDLREIDALLRGKLFNAGERHRQDIDRVVEITDHTTCLGKFGGLQKIPSAITTHDRKMVSARYINQISHPACSQSISTKYDHFLPFYGSI